MSSAFAPDTSIPRSRQYPKILWIDDAKVVGDGITKASPVLGDFVAQEIERDVRELSACGVAFPDGVTQNAGKKSIQKNGKCIKRHRDGKINADSTDEFTQMQSQCLTHGSLRERSLILGLFIVRAFLGMMADVKAYEGDHDAEQNRHPPAPALVCCLWQYLCHECGNTRAQQHASSKS